ncbi:hypothetical protein WR25_10950 [Diploscapter pachys]|uniref:Tryptophan synthase beta chain-like PALP domain-containing protein n=1 Tax=Diploscapter pachys TaxID=2018661 RepID=A0A2A2LY09_9BILA|nr:hypothetical protein WR25_10950 [Diploscapter pachys]
MVEISIDEMEKARKRIEGKVHRTPVIQCEAINKIAGTTVHFKCDHLQKTGSFKSRGTINAILCLNEEKGDKCKGVVTYSGGNHGQALAWAALQCDIPCCVVAFSIAPQLKKDAMIGYKAELVYSGNTLGEIEVKYHETKAKLGYDAVEPFNDVGMINGHASCAAEILEQVPEADAVFVAVGGGGLASAIAMYVGEKRPDIKVYIVEPEAKQLKPYLEKGKMPDYDTINTIADGIRVLKVGDLCKEIFCKYSKETIISVTEDEIRKALALIWTRTKVD